MIDASQVSQEVSSKSRIVPNHHVESDGLAKIHVGRTDLLMHKEAVHSPPSKHSIDIYGKFKTTVEAHGSPAMSGISTEVVAMAESWENVCSLGWTGKFDITNAQQRYTETSDCRKVFNHNGRRCFIRSLIFVFVYPSNPIAHRTVIPNSSLKISHVCCVVTVFLPLRAHVREEHSGMSDAHENAGDGDHARESQHRVNRINVGCTHAPSRIKNSFSFCISSLPQPPAISGRLFRVSIV